MPKSPPTGLESVEGVHLIQPLKEILNSGEEKPLGLVRFDLKSEREAKNKGLKARSVEEINRDVTRLANILGVYKLNKFNCEYYATAIVYGRGFSKQVDEVVGIIATLLTETSLAVSGSFIKSARN
jgi:hypothetical protein